MTNPKKTKKKSTAPSMTAAQVEQNLKDPLAADWSTLNPKDVRVGLGPLMTEEQMMAYCKQHGIAAPFIAGNVSLDPSSS